MRLVCGLLVIAVAVLAMYCHSLRQEIRANRQLVDDAKTCREQLEILRPQWAEAMARLQQPGVKEKK